MLIGVLSDTHNELERTRRALRRLADAGAQVLIHCGDLATPPIVAALAAVPAYFVLGNHDADMALELRSAAELHGVHCLGWRGVIELSGRRVAIAHGHLTSDIRCVMSEHPHFLLTGHAHEAFESVRDGVPWMNPGALFRAVRYTVATLDLLTGEIRWLEISETD